MFYFLAESPECVLHNLWAVGASQRRAIIDGLPLYLWSCILSLLTKLIQETLNNFESLLIAMVHKHTSVCNLDCCAFFKRCWSLNFLLANLSLDFFGFSFPLLLALFLDLLFLSLFFFILLILFNLFYFRNLRKHPLICQVAALLATPRSARLNWMGGWTKPLIESRVCE